eukprot:TRINITY_DN290_c3_g1_i1.p1 TRINITY_DN290_c3_g1~~TRINITY_DN290_c3_g1_i1.p1  ORF type:complete len:1118 (-),score=344.25 TRINITY_DN290_c3_g1_i1:358-3396(-)
MIYGLPLSVPTAPDRIVKTAPGAYPSLLFSFPFFDQIRKGFVLRSDGYLHFGDSKPCGSTFISTACPITEYTNGIMPLLSDLKGMTSSTFDWELSYDNSRTYVRYDHVKTDMTGSSIPQTSWPTQTFSISLHETGSIRFFYEELHLSDFGEFGEDWYAGIINSDGSKVTVDPDQIVDSQGITFWRHEKTVAISPIQNRVGDELTLSFPTILELPEDLKWESVELYCDIGGIKTKISKEDQVKANKTILKCEVPDIEVGGLTLGGEGQVLMLRLFMKRIFTTEEITLIQTLRQNGVRVDEWIEMPLNTKILDNSNTNSNELENGETIIKVFAASHASMKIDACFLGNPLLTPDGCGICGGDNSNVDCWGACNGAGVLDCAGTCDGVAEKDCAGTCNGDAKYDCNSECQGTAAKDVCNICAGGSTGLIPGATLDCKGICGGQSVCESSSSGGSSSGSKSSSSSGSSLSFCEENPSHPSCDKTNGADDVSVLILGSIIIALVMFVGSMFWCLSQNEEERDPLNLDPNHFPKNAMDKLLTQLRTYYVPPSENQSNQDEQIVQTDKNIPVPTGLIGQPREDECVVCLGEFEFGKKYVELSCRHSFHVDCITEWFERSLCCPICKANVPNQLGFKYVGHGDEDPAGWVCDKKEKKKKKKNNERKNRRQGRRDRRTHRHRRERSRNHHQTMVNNPSIPMQDILENQMNRQQQENGVNGNELSLNDINMAMNESTGNNNNNNNNDNHHNRNNQPNNNSNDNNPSMSLANVRSATSRQNNGVQSVTRTLNPMLLTQNTMTALPNSQQQQQQQQHSRSILSVMSSSSINAASSSTSPLSSRRKRRSPTSQDIRRQRSTPHHQSPPKMSPNQRLRKRRQPPLPMAPPMLSPMSPRAIITSRRANRSESNSSTSPQDLRSPLHPMRINTDLETCDEIIQGCCPGPTPDKNGCSPRPCAMRRTSFTGQQLLSPRLTPRLSRAFPTMKGGRRSSGNNNSGSSSSHGSTEGGSNNNNNGVSGSKWDI